MHRSGRLLLVLDNEARHTVLDHLGNGAGAICDNGRSAGHRLDHDQSERLGPIDWKQQGGGLRQERLLFGIVDLSDQMNLLAVDERFKTLLEVTGLAARDLGCNAKRSPDCVRDADSIFRSLLGGETSEKRQISAL